MGKFYGIKIQRGEMTLEKVPRLWQEVTKKWLKQEEK